MNGGNGGGGIGSSGTDITGLPFRTGAPAGTFAYGCPPFEPAPPLVPDFAPPVPPFDWKTLRPETVALIPCPKCTRHRRVTELLEPCPFCLRSELDALKLALGEKAKPAEEIERLRVFLRKILGAARDIHQVTGSARLAELLAEGDAMLEAPGTEDAPAK